MNPKESPPTVLLESISYVPEPAPLPPLETCYLIPLDIEEWVRGAIEYYCGLQPNELDLKSAFNTIEVRADMAESFRQERWALLPSQRTLSRLASVLKHNQMCPAEERKSVLDVLPIRPRRYAIIGVGTKSPLTGNATFPNGPLAQSDAHPMCAVYASLSARVVFLQAVDSSYLKVLTLKSLLASDPPLAFQSKSERPSHLISLPRAEEDKGPSPTTHEPSTADEPVRHVVRIRAPSESRNQPRYVFETLDPVKKASILSWVHGVTTEAGTDVVVDSQPGAQNESPVMEATI